MDERLASMPTDKNLTVTIKVNDKEKVWLRRDDAFWLLLRGNTGWPFGDADRLDRIEEELNAQPIMEGRPVEPRPEGQFDVYVVVIRGEQDVAPIAVRTDKDQAIAIAQIWNLAEGGKGSAQVIGYDFDRAGGRQVVMPLFPNEP
jgi:hypothetical protein